MMVGNEGNDEERNPSSWKSLLCSFIRFCNKTQRRVDIIWINYEGVGVKYKTLDPGGYLDVNTFVSHPWIFMDSETHDKLVVRAKEVFEPEPWFQPYLPYLQAGQLRRDQIRPRRVLVNITIPVYSLKDRSMQVIRKLLSKRERAFRLDIPTTLRTEVASGMTL